MNGQLAQTIRSGQGQQKLYELSRYLRLGPNTIVIKDFLYSPEPLHAKAGVALTVTNTDDTVHTVTADDKSFDTGDISGGAKGTITIDKPGKYAYHCDIHNYMTGTIEVS